MFDESTPQLPDAANGPPVAPKADAAPAPFDPASLRIRGDLSNAMGVRKVLTSVPVRKPDRSSFVRVHPDDAYALETAVIELKEERETYLVAPALWPALAGEATFATRVRFTAITRQATVFLWPCRLPGPDGRLDDWGRTALDAARLARARWVRVTANMALGAYDVFEDAEELTDPEWPQTPFRELLSVAFRDKLIDRADHPVLRRLRGEA
jgi:hypothetical protein